MNNVNMSSYCIDYQKDEKNMRKFFAFQNIAKCCRLWKGKNWMDVLVLRGY